MSGLETIVILSKVGLTLITFVGGAILKYLYDIKSSSKRTEQDFHNFKSDFNIEISNLKNKIDIIDSKTKDSYNKSESDYRLVALENKVMKELTDHYTKLRELIYSAINRTNQKNNNTTKD